MTKYILPFTIFLIYQWNILCAQSVASLHPNDKVPDISLGYILNEPSKKLRFSDFKGKLLILDFWNIHCTNCIASMPKMDSLQKEFSDSVQIIYVTKNSENDVNKLFSRVKIKKPDVPFIVNDTVLNSFFPHNGDPLHVWIDKEGLVYAIAFDYSTNSYTIKHLLSGLAPKLANRWDYGIDQNQPIVSQQNGAVLSLANSYSIFFNSLTDYSTENSIYVEKDSTTGLPVLLRTINAPALMLYSIAFDRDLYGADVNYFNLRKNNRVIFETTDSSIFFPPKQESLLDDWMTNNIFSYEIKVKKGSGSQLYKNMQEDLNRYLPYKAVIEKREMKCLVLKSIPNATQSISKDNNLPTQIISNNDNTISIQNMPSSSFVSQLIYENSNINLPIIDDSHFSGRMNVKLKSKLSNLQSLALELEKYGFILCEENQAIDMLILRDKINSNSSH